MVSIGEGGWYVWVVVVECVCPQKTGRRARVPSGVVVESLGSLSLSLAHSRVVEALGGLASCTTKIGILTPTRSGS